MKPSNHTLQVATSYGHMAGNKTKLPPGTWRYIRGLVTDYFNSDGTDEDLDKFSKALLEFCRKYKIDPP